jgi:hypothetical protein
VDCLGKAFEVLLVVCVAFAVVSMLSLQVVLCNDFDYDWDQKLDPWGTWGNIAEIYGYHSTNPFRYAHELHHAKAWTSWPMVVVEGDVDFIGINGQEYNLHIDISALDYDNSTSYDYYTGSLITNSYARFYNSVLHDDFWIYCTASVIAGSEP